MIYGWRSLHPDLPSYDSGHFLSQPELSHWIPRSFTRNKFISKDLYIVTKKISNDQEKFIFLQHPISYIQEKEKIVDKNIFEEHFVYYDAIFNQEVLQDYYPYLMTKDTSRNMELLINSLRIHQKYQYQYQDYLDKIEILDKISSSSKTKYLPIDRLVWYDHYQKEIRESNLFY